MSEVFVEITLNNQEYTDDRNIFYYYHPPFLFSFGPEMGSVIGGTIVHVFGSNFRDTKDLKCKFGTISVPAKFISTNEILCVSPKTDHAGLVPFQIAVQEDEFTSDETKKFLYYAFPELNSISPSCGPIYGYTQLTVKGKNFFDNGLDSVKCVFNKTIFMNATIIDDTTLYCSTPSIINRYEMTSTTDDLFFDVEVTMNAKDFSGFPQRFYYYNDPQLKGIYPNSGSVEGNTLTKIKGLGFKPDHSCNLTVRFSTYQIKPIEVDDDSITVKSPPVSIHGEVIVGISINGQQFTKDIIINNKDIENTFTYFNSPIFTYYFPSLGPSNGGSLVKISGYGFRFYEDIEGKAITKNIWIRMKDVKSGKYSIPKIAEFADNENIHFITPPGDPYSHHIIEVSFNEIDYYPVILKGQNYSFSYYLAPKIESIDPPYGYVRSNKQVILTVKGKNFKCPNDQCENVICRFGKEDNFIFSQGTLIKENEIQCKVPKYSKPDVLPIEITLNGQDYTNNGLEYGFYDPFIYKVTPKMISKKGNTKILIHGHGFVNTTGSHLKVRFGSKEKPLKCKEGSCIIPGKYVDKNTIEAQTFPYNLVTYDDGKPIYNDEFPVEVMVYGDEFTENNVSVFYFSEPTYSKEIIPAESPANEEELIIIPADLKIYSENGSKAENQEKWLRKYGNATCRFKHKNGKEIIVPGSLSHYPFKSTGEFNAIFCKAPLWSLDEGVEKEDVTLDVSINGGADYSGNILFTFSEKLEVYKIFPKCGPTIGNTKIRIYGTGFKQKNDLNVKFGTVHSIKLDKSSIEEFTYKKGLQISQNKYETEYLNLNENSKIMFVSGKKYKLTSCTSPQIPIFALTHGGSHYFELTKALKLKMVNSEDVHAFTYGSQQLEFYFYMQPSLYGIHPRGGSIFGGTIVVLKGAWFKFMPEYGIIPYAKFGEKVVKCEFESTVRIICMSPALGRSDINSVEVSVSLNSIDFSADSFKYNYFEELNIIDIFPKSGPESGGTKIHVRAKHVSNMSESSEFLCKFTSRDSDIPPKLVSAIFENSSYIICISPGGWGKGTSANLEITYNGKDYTNSNSSFNFYNFLDIYPRSSPSDGSGGYLTITGSGFKESSHVKVKFDGVPYDPTEVKWDIIKVKIPKAKEKDFFGTVQLEVSLNGIDYHEIEGGFHYYPPTDISDFYPKFSPAKGKGIVKFYGNNFRSDFSLAQPKCKFGPYIGKAEVISQNEIICHVPPIDQINRTYKGEIALNGQTFVEAKSGADFIPYGIYRIEPNSGNLNYPTQITVYGEGFQKDGKPQCKFGVSGNYAIVEGKVISPQRMVCNAPSKYDVPPYASLPLSVPFSISFFEEKYDPWAHYDLQKEEGVKGIKFESWTESGHKYRFYSNPQLQSLKPTEGRVRDITDVFVFADPKHTFTQPVAPIDSIDKEVGVRCMFGRFGTSPGVYINATTIKCITPLIKDDPDTIFKEIVYVQVALNGQDFTDKTDKCLFTFYGDATYFIYWPYFIGFMLIALFLVAFLVLCFTLISKYNQPYRIDNNASQAVLPHIVRDYYGVDRTRGIFAPGGEREGRRLLPGQSGIHPEIDNKINTSLMDVSMSNRGNIAGSRRGVPSSFFKNQS